MVEAIERMVFGSHQEHSEGRFGKMIKKNIGGKNIRKIEEKKEKEKGEFGKRKKRKKMKKKNKKKDEKK